jgi:hypothetical protein
MGDVLVIWQRVFLALAAVRAVTVVFDGGLWPGLLMLAGCCAGWVGRYELLAMGAFACTVFMGGSNSVTLIGWVALAVHLFDGAELVTVLRAQTVIVYGFAVANKMFSGFASGHVITVYAPWMPYPKVVAGLVLFTEAMLGVAVLRRWPIALAVAVPAHIGFAVGVADNLEHLAALAAFNGMLVLLVWATSVDVSHVPVSPRAAEMTSR